MLQSLTADLAVLPGVRVLATLDSRLDGKQLRAETTAVCSHRELDAAFASLTSEATAIVVIAPEDSDVAVERCREVRAAGKLWLGCEPSAIEAVRDKLELPRLLGPKGVRTLAAQALESVKRWDRPLVIKPRRGAGSEGVFLWRPGDLLPCAEAASIATPWVDGTAASVLFIARGQSRRALLPCRQVLSTDGRLHYLGGESPLESDCLAARALALAEAAVAALPGLAGFVGVDLVLAADGEHLDTVVEVNPRLTFSYVGLRRLANENLAGAWLEAMDSGTPPPLTWRPGPVAFSAEGVVSVLDPHREPSP